MQRSVGRLFSWLYRLRGTADKRAAASHRIRKYFVRDRPPRRNDDGPFQDVGKLADIAGPVIEHECVQHLAVHVLEALVARVSLQEMLHQQGNVRLALPQRREMDGDDVDAVVEVAAHGPFIDPLEEIPVLAKAGAIIPMTEKISALDVESNPDELTVRVYAGADNTFALYEDDNTTMAYEKDDCAKTSMTLDWGARKFTIAPVEGNQSLVPESRMYCVEFGGSTAKEAKVFVNGVEADAEVKEKDGLLTIAVTDVKPQDTVTICLPEDTEIAKNDVMTRAMDLLLHAEISYITKEQIANLLHKADGKVAILAAELQSMELSNDLRGALLEIITA